VEEKVLISLCIFGRCYRKINIFRARERMKEKNREKEGKREK
jgi:hypothetical protein